MRLSRHGLTGLALTAALPAIGAAGHGIRMLDRGEAGAMMFEPALLRVAPGGTVRLLAANRGRDAGSPVTMASKATPRFHGHVDQEIAISFERPGRHGYPVQAASRAGMVGPAMVGEAGAAANLERARGARHPARAREGFGRMFREIGG